MSVDTRRLAIACATLFAGCGHFKDLATTYAREGDLALAEVRAGGTLASEECRFDARYLYLQVRLGIGPLGPSAKPISWPAWYAETTSSTSPTTSHDSWAAYCKKVGDTGLLFNDAVVALRNYGSSILVLSTAKDFDASGLQSAVSGGASIADSLGVGSALTSAAASIGSPLVSLGQFVGNEIRQRQLESYVSRSDPIVQDLLGRMAAYLETLEAEVRHAQSHRTAVVEILGLDGRTTMPLWESVSIAELAIDGERKLAELQENITLLKTILKLCSDAHAQLAQLARHKADNAQTEAELKRFQRELEKLRGSRDWRQ